MQITSQKTKFHILILFREHAIMGSQGFCALYYVLTPETTLELWNYLAFMMTNDMIYH